MSESVPPDLQNLSFSQRHNYEPIPESLNLEELSRDAHVQLWNVLYHFVNESSKSSFDGGFFVGSPWRDILWRAHQKFWSRPVDEYSGSLEEFCDTYKEFICTTGRFNKIFDLFEFIMRHPACPDAFIEEIDGVFKECRLAYRLDKSRPVTIYPAATRQEGDSILESLQQLRTAGLGGAVTHLRKASACINNRDFEDGVRESIQAVESVARQIVPGAKTLGPALDKLEQSGHLHPAFKQAMSKLYGYTSDEQGVRHALLEQESSRVGMDEAVYMLGACASFASFLWRKHKSNEEQAPGQP